MDALGLQEPTGHHFDAALDIVLIWKRPPNFSALVTDKTVDNFYSDSAPIAREFVVSLQARLLNW